MARPKLLRSYRWRPNKPSGIRIAIGGKRRTDTVVVVHDQPNSRTESLSTDYLYHAASVVDWAKRSSTDYRPSSFEDEGFIHLSTAAQLLTPLHSYYPGRKDLLLLTIDEKQISAPVIWEDLYEGDQEFPHVYGELNLSAVLAIDAIPCDENGRFDWLVES